MKIRKRILFIIALVIFLAGVFSAPIVDDKIHRQPKEWTVMDSKAYAKDMLSVWKDEQWICLENLWSKESNWRPEAYNKIKVMGKNAGGIPQLLGLDPKTPAPRQIERGLDYIYNRYDTPCNAWAFFKKKGYH